mmetsp:Transcript_6343/g.15356  ORF Transcript_6343/g.15356 Transcript_6343/m.15356 type:complete len:150 (-) Transcript_6343:18-467(-)
MTPSKRSLRIGKKIKSSIFMWTSRIAIISPNVASAPETSPATALSVNSFNPCLIASWVNLMYANGRTGGGPPPPPGTAAGAAGAGLDGGFAVATVGVDWAGGAGGGACAAEGAFGSAGTAVGATGAADAAGLLPPQPMSHYCLFAGRLL